VPTIPLQRKAKTRNPRSDWDNMQENYVNNIKISQIDETIKTFL
jgi:hypothetical protein